jgi:2-polyprenyl-3-methyl-5-hydroxy-6-metoxy-1,4-benzoquinol methylase
VGESGAVVGIDRSEAAILAARTRAATAKNVHFLVTSPDDTLNAASFDVVIGTYVLIFQDDVRSFIRASARLVKPGGIVAFHEIDDADDFAALPEVPLWKQANDWLITYDPCCRIPMFPEGWWTASPKRVSAARSCFVKCQSEMESDRQ